MKKLNTIIIVLLIISITLNIFQFHIHSVEKINENEVVLDKNNIEKFKKSCYIMFANYFVNPEGWIEFTLPPVKECLIKELLNKWYNVDGVIDKVLYQLIKFQEKYPDSKILTDYISQLKKNFEYKIDAPDRAAINTALKIIWDKEFEEKLLEDWIINK